jgi:tetratricopeptide (TPR) repeat protein
VTRPTKVPARSGTLEIFCDGGFGNRYNSLISGLALAENCGLKVKVYWPKNGSCEAGFADIFATNLLVSESNLLELAGTLEDAFCLLHDTLGSDTLKVTFRSAYDYQSTRDFAAKVIDKVERIFYYPALIPAWIEEASIHRAVRGLEIRPELVSKAEGFIRTRLAKPYYGLHLRRTDLNVGLSDAEVQFLVGRYPNEEFYVCSDDPIAEAMAAIHPHVHRREKLSYVSKRNRDGGWQSPTADDSGRMYFSNIRRGKDATLEGVIDLLVLGQSQIISYTGSTFQSVARLIGSVLPLLDMTKPPPIVFTAAGDVSRMIRNRVLPLNQLMGVCEELISSGRLDDAVALLQIALEHEVGMGRFVVLYNLGVYTARLEHYQHAMIFFRAALEISPESAEAKEAYFQVAQLAQVSRPE